jgi:hypothetical protein
VCSRIITYSALKTVVMAKSIWKLVTDSFLVAKMQQTISAMSPVHNKPILDVSIAVSRILTTAVCESAKTLCLGTNCRQ